MPAESKNAMRQSRAAPPWYAGLVYLLSWFGIFFAVVLPLFYYRLPTSLRASDEGSHHHQNEFIAERAAHTLLELELLGPKPAGSASNTNDTVQLLLQELDKIRRSMRTDRYELLVETQVASGSFYADDTWYEYEGVRNVLVQLRRKQAAPPGNALLVSTHYDTLADSVGSGRSGAMVAILLEVLRVLASSEVAELDQPIVFLLNGAKEYGNYGAHAFSQHEWAAQCAAFVNLDAIGSGDQELLMWAGGDWLLQHYGASVSRPFGSSLIEEFFSYPASRYEFMTADTYTLTTMGGDGATLPGLDIRHYYNGHVDQTPYDKYYLIPHQTLQATGANLLALLCSLSDADELKLATSARTAHEAPLVYYDLMRFVLVRYGRVVANVLNIGLPLAALLVFGGTAWRIAALNRVSLWRVLRIFAYLLLALLAGWILALALPTLIAWLCDGVGGAQPTRTLIWYTHKWLAVGLYVCPALFGLALPPLLLLQFYPQHKLNASYQLQLLLHAHSLLLALVCLAVHICGYQSAYVFMVTLAFHLITATLNLASTLLQRRNYWAVMHVVGQVLPFLYFCYMTFVLLNLLVPATGRMGSAYNPDYLVAWLCAVGALLAFGFVLPLLHLFRRGIFVLLALLGCTALFALLSLTRLGFPYRETTQVQRLHFMEVRRIFYNANNTITADESGLYFDFQDRRRWQPIEASLDFSQLRSIDDDCAQHMLCGLPFPNSYWLKSRGNGYWLPLSEQLPLIAPRPQLLLLSKSTNATNGNMLYNFILSSGPAQMSLFLQPLTGVQISWSFNNGVVKPTSQPPFRITLMQNSASMLWHFTVRCAGGAVDGPKFELGLSAHYLERQYARSPMEFRKSLPAYTYAMEWPSLYERFVY